MSQADVMRELARSSQLVRKPVDVPTEAIRPSRAEARSSGVRRPTNPWVTTPPKVPDIEETSLDKIEHTIRKQPLIVGAGLMIVVLVLILKATTGTQYVEQPHPRLLEPGDVRALAIPVSVPMDVVFSVLGTQAPRAVPNEPRLERYTYGADLEIDAINGQVYAVTFRVPNREWRNLRVGLSEDNARGALALLGTPHILEDAVDVALRTVGDYRVFPSLTERPRKTMVVEVRPPNGCFDVLADLQPPVAGILLDGSRRYAVVESPNAEWAVTQIRVLSRSIRGPYAPGAPC